MLRTIASGLLLAGILVGCAERSTSGTDEDLPVTSLQERGLGLTYNDAGVPWPKQIGSSARDVMGAVSAYPTGTVYAVGTTQGLIGTPPSSSLGSGDFFVAKFESSSGIEGPWWLDTQGTISNDHGYSIVAGDQSAYIAGMTYGSLPGQTQSGNGDIFLRKISSLGSILWTTQIGTSALDVGYSVARVASTLFVAASTEGGLDGNTSAGGSDVALIKYDGNGTKYWTRQLGTSGYDYAHGVSVDGTSNAYVAGTSDQGLDGNIGLGGNDAIIVKYDTAGVKQWTRQFGSNTLDIARAIATDASGNSYVVGYTLGQWGGATSAGSMDGFITKYDTAGVHQWTRLIGSSGGDTAVGACVDGIGNVYVVGRADGDFDGQTRAGDADAYLTKFNAAGVKQWTRFYGSTAFDSASSVTMQNARIVVGGVTDGALPGRVNQGNSDVFLVRYDSAGNLAP